MSVEKRRPSQAGGDFSIPLVSSIPGASSTSPEEIAAGRFGIEIGNFRLVGVTAALFGAGMDAPATDVAAQAAPEAPAGPAAPVAEPTTSGVLGWAEGPWIRLAGRDGEVSTVDLAVPEGWSGTLQFVMGPVVGTHSATQSQVWISDGENIVAGPVEGSYYAGITTDALEGGKHYQLHVAYTVPTVMSVGILHDP